MGAGIHIALNQNNYIEIHRSLLYNHKKPRRGENIMSLAIVTYVPEGIVMASDSRQSITIENRAPDGKDLGKLEIINSDSVYKTYLLSRKGQKRPSDF